MFHILFIISSTVDTINLQYKQCDRIFRKSLCKVSDFLIFLLCSIFLFVFSRIHCICCLCVIKTLQDVEACDSMNGCLNCLAQEYPTVKFCKIRASNATLSLKFVSTGILIFTKHKYDNCKNLLKQCIYNFYKNTLCYQIVLTCWNFKKKNGQYKDLLLQRYIYYCMYTRQFSVTLKLCFSYYSSLRMGFLPC